MPLTRSVSDALDLVTICLACLLIIAGLLCIVYSFYFRFCVRGQGFLQLGYFSAPWIIRITFILFIIWWGIGEIIRLSFFRREGRILNTLSLKWQEIVCKCYVVSNLGFAEPGLFLTLVFLFRAPLQGIRSGILTRKWNGKTAGYVLLYCLPMFVLQLFIVLIGSQLHKDKSIVRNPPHYLTRTLFASTTKSYDDTALCTYPLLSTGLLGILVTVLTVYLIWLGRRILKQVINKGLQKRVYALIFSVLSFLPLRIFSLGLSVLSKPGHLLFEALAFTAFLALLCFAGVCMRMLVYCPIADSLALGNLQDLESRRMTSCDHNDTLSLIAYQGPSEECSGISPQRISETSTKAGSISFRTLERDDALSGTFLELSFFSPGHDGIPPTSSTGRGWPMRTPT